MDEAFFRKVMKAVGLPFTVIDDTIFERKTEMDDIQILSKNYYQAKENYPCAWADDNHSIKKGRRYVRVVVKPADADIQTQKVCLECWVKP